MGARSFSVAAPKLWNGSTKIICAKEWSEKHIFHSHFFYFQSKAKMHA